MKKITFAIALLTLGIQAQTFPNPYCDITEYLDIEEITNIEFGTAVIQNADATAVLLDHTATVVNVNPGDTYTILVEGHTNGNFETNIVAFIDWNQNGVLDDAGEVYEIGTLENTTGDDGVFVTMDITVPADALLGTTRIRVTKVYTDVDSPAVIDPCVISMEIPGYGIFEGFGQAIDFTLDVEAVPAEPFPNPYCDITEYLDIEEITNIEFGTAVIQNADATAVLLDHTATVVNVNPGDTYTILVEGTTNGNFETNIVAFIDWNQNGVLDDAGEIYEIGTLEDTTGDDGVFVTMDITVPADALSGTTRIRVTKVYTDVDSPAVIDPCAISMEIPGYGIFEGFGQAIDFTLNVGTLSVSQFEANALSVYPNPTKDILNIEYKSKLSTVKIYNLLGQEMLTQNTDQSQLQLDVSSLSTGAYIVKLFTEEGQHSFRVLKQ